MSSPKHGEKRCYATGCRRPECREAMVTYEFQRRRNIAYGRWDVWADAKAVYVHYWELSDSGLPDTRIMELADVSKSTIARIKSGHILESRRGVTKNLASRLLAVEPDPENFAPQNLVDSSGTQRRARALHAYGYSLAWQGEQFGMHPDAYKFAIRQDRVRKDLRDKVADLYETWGSHPAPDSAHATRCRRFAARMGWPNPYQWDDDLLDLTDEELQAELSRRAGQMSDAETQRCSLAVREGDISPQIVAGHDEYQKRKYWARRAKYLLEKGRAA